MLPNKIAFVDVETTGMNPTNDRIIEIGILRVEDGSIVSQYNQLINPGGLIPEVIQGMTGITNADLENAPTFREIKHDIGELLADCTFVAHNVRFDYSFLKNEFRREGIRYTSGQFCTVKLARQLYPRLKRYNLDSLIETFAFSCPNRHRAFDDASVLWQFYQMLLKEYSADEVDQAIKIISRRPTSPIHLPSKTLKDLPETSGVYIFYGDDNVPLYVGKSKNIKYRVHSHFSADAFSTKEMQMAQQVKRIETIQTVGELGALLKESQLVKSLQPQYNRRLRRTIGLTYLLSNEDDFGYARAEIVHLAEIEPGQFANIIGLFRTKRQAKQFLDQVAGEYQLCKKLLGIERATKDCFSNRLGICNGACVQREQPLKYNMRFAQAFATTKIKSWPFSGPIAFVEEDPITESGEAYIIDQWCLIGSVTYNKEYDLTHFLKSPNIDKVVFSDTSLAFDLDTYKIFVNFIFNEKMQKNIHVLNTSLQRTSPLPETADEAFV